MPKLKSPKQKGRRFEAEIAALYRHHHIDDSAQPMPMSGAMSFHKGDLLKKNDHEFVDECKNQEKVSLWECWSQAKAQAKGLQKPVLHIRRNHTPPITIMDTDDWFQLRVELMQLRRQVGID